jgi:hypothetical protein
MSSEGDIIKEFQHRLSHRKQFIADHFDSLPGDDDWEPRSLLWQLAEPIGCRKQEAFD